MPDNTYNLAYGDIVYPSVQEFITNSQRKLEQEQRIGKRTDWNDAVDAYLAAIEILSIDPFPDPEEEEELKKTLVYGSQYTNFYYLKIDLKNGTGHHRFIYAVHNYSIIVLLHYFDKKTKAVPVQEIQKAEVNYEAYLEDHPSKYDIRKEQK